MNKVGKYIFPAIAAAVLIILGFYFSHREANAPGNETEMAATTTAVTQGGMTLETSGNGKATIEQIPISNTAKLPPLPNLNRLLVFPANMAAEVRAALSMKISISILALKSNPKDASAALELGLYRKMLEDYTGAEEIWLYVTALSPTYYVAYANLGDLYGFYLKDYTKAERNYRKVIELKPDAIQAYRSLHDLYRYSYAEKASQAEAILLEGIQKNPGNADLAALLEEYRKEIKAQ